MGHLALGVFLIIVGRQAVVLVADKVSKKLQVLRARQA